MDNNLGNLHCARNFDDLQEAYAAIIAIAARSDAEMDAQDVEALENAIFSVTDGLAALLLQQQLQAQLDCETHRAKEKELLSELPGKLRYEGLEWVTLRSASGVLMSLQFRYYRRRCDEKPGKRHKGVYPGVLVLGLHDRTTPLLASRVSTWSALLSSFAEVQQVLREHHVELDVKVLRHPENGNAPPTKAAAYGPTLIKYSFK